MQTTPILFTIFSSLCILFFIVRNFFYFRLRKYEQEIKDKGLYTSIFPKGVKKMMEPIELIEDIKNNDIIYLIKKVNLFSYLAITSLILCVLGSLFESLFI